MTVAEFAHRHRRAVVFLLGALAVAGVYAAFRLPIALFPAVTFPRIVVLADDGERPVERMRVEVTMPLEEAARGVAGVRTVRSKTSRGATEISVLVDWGADVLATQQLLDGRIAALRGVLPATVAVRTERMDVSVFPILGYSLASDRRTPVELRDLALYTLRPELLRIDGVARVDVAGGATREIHVVPDPMALAAQGLSLADVSTAIQAANVSEASGLVTANHELYLAVTDNGLQGLEDVAGVVLATRAGAPVRVRDVARVEAATADEIVRIRAQGRDAVLVDIARQPDGNTVGIARDARAAMDRLRRRMPPDVHVETYMDQSEFIADSIAGTRDAILVGVVLAMGILLLFLRSVRITLVAAIVVPATIAATLGALAAIGQSINIMTLGGIAAAVGLVIDDVIVVVEGVFHALPGASGFRAATNAALRNLGAPIIGSTLATLVIHVPFAFLGGLAGAFFSALSITMVLALSLSFLFSVLLAPLVAGRLLGARAATAAAARETRRLTHVSGYARGLRSALRFAPVAPVVLVLLVAAGAWVYRYVGSGFLPDMDEGAFVLDYVTPPGTSLDETDRMLRGVEAILQATPEVAEYGRRTGTELGFFVTEPNTGDILVRLHAGRKRSVFAVIDDVRARIEATQPAMQIEFGQQLQDVIGDLIDNPSPIEIKVFGDDKQSAETVARRVAALIEPIDGVADVFDGVVVSGPSLAVQVDPVRASAYGLTVQDVHTQLAGAIGGVAQTQLVRADKQIAIRTRLDDAVRRDPAAVRALLLRGTDGVLIPLDAVAKVGPTAGVTETVRENLKPMVAVTADLAGRDLGSTVRDIRSTLTKGLALPAGVSIEYAGIYRTQQESFRGLLLVLGAAIVLVFVVLLFQFESFRAPLVVLAIALPSLAGTVGALALTHTSFNVSSFVGAILVVGIVAENAIFLLHAMECERRAGRSLHDAVVAGAQGRLRPILMTCCAAVCALAPLALGFGAGAAMQQPLAVAVIGGFAVSTALLLLVMPLLYVLVEGRSGGQA